MTSGASTVLASAETALAAHDYELAIEVLVDGVAELRSSKPISRRLKGESSAELHSRATWPDPHWL